MDNNYIYASNLIHLFEVIRASIRCLPLTPANTYTGSRQPTCPRGFPQEEWEKSAVKREMSGIQHALTHLPTAAGRKHIVWKAVPSPGLVNKGKLFK